MPKLCKPTIEAIQFRMQAAERLNNIHDATARGVFDLKIFGITHPTKTGLFTVEDLLEELKLQNKKPTMTVPEIQKKVRALKVKLLELEDITALIKSIERNDLKGVKCDGAYLTACKRRKQILINHFEKIFGKEEQECIK